MPRAPAAVRLEQGHGQLLADEGRQVKVGRGAEGIDVEYEQFVDRFAPGKALGHQRLGQASFLRAGQRNEPRVLAQAGTEKAGRQYF